MRPLKILGILLITVINLSCNSDNDVSSEQVLSGVFTESLPYAGIHQLNFVNNNTLILKARGSTAETFAYQINAHIITLTPTRDLSQNWDLEINFLNNSTFEIQKVFYASIPEVENPLQVVTFEKNKR